jgi:hypothetical protein
MCVKTMANKPNPVKLVEPTHSTTSPLEDISDLLDNVPFAARVEVTRQLITSISSLPNGEDLGVPLFADHIRAPTASFYSKFAEVAKPLVGQLGRSLC